MISQEYSFDAGDINPTERVALQRLSVLRKIGLETESGDARCALHYTGTCHADSCTWQGRVLNDHCDHWA